jgi:hypothetical protein
MRISSLGVRRVSSCLKTVLAVAAGFALAHVASAAADDGWTEQALFIRWSPWTSHGATRRRVASFPGGGQLEYQVTGAVERYSIDTGPVSCWASVPKGTVFTLNMGVVDPDGGAKVFNVDRATSRKNAAVTVRTRGPDRIVPNVVAQ